MDKAMALHLQGDFAASNTCLEEAHQKIEELYTKSISKEALSFVGNDAALAFVGEDFEKVMVNLLGMLNYTLLGKLDDALVEARRVDSRLKAYADQYGDKALYREDGLARYISAVLYEMKGEFSDAYIDYKKAQKAYVQYGQAYGTAEPSFLRRDLVRLASGLGGFQQDLKRYREQYGAVSFDSLADLKSRKGEVLLLLYSGLAPVKIDRFVTVPVPGDNQYFRMAFPQFVARPEALENAELAPSSGAAAPLELAEDVTKIAIKDLQARIVRISVKATARGIAKFQAGRQVQKAARDSGNPFLEILAFLGSNAYTLVSEEADKRSWRTLPGRVYLVRMALDPGVTSLSLRMQMPEGTVVRDFPNLQIVAGKKIFLRAMVY
jgi:hypothetical protein